MGFWDSIVGALNSFFDILFGWSVNIHPVFGIIFVTIIIAAIVTLIYKYATDQRLMKEHKEDLKKIQKKIKALQKSDPKKAMSMQSEAMKKSMSMMKQSFKPMIFTFIPIVLLFGWLRATYDPMEFALFGFLNWFWTYFIFTMIFSFAFRKLFKVY
jgi:uncharacterized membrane protein (DUF106 family)